MSLEKYSLQFFTKGPSFWKDMIALLLAIGLSLLLFFFLKQPMVSLSPLPILLVAVWIIFPKLGPRSDQAIFLGFFILCFFIDDVAFAPWGTVNTFTKEMGIILFQSFGLTGIEVFAISFAILCFIITSREEHRRWIRLGIRPFLLIASLVFFSALIATGFGLITGGSLVTSLIQIRFMYLFPIWAFIGFVVLRDESYFRKIFFWLTMLMVFKSLQLIFNYMLNREVYAEAEYIYEHYFSAYLTVAMLQLLYWMWRRPEGLVKLICLLAFALSMLAYILDARRTSYVGIPFAIAILLFFLPKTFMRVYGRWIVTTVVFSGVITAATWNLPAPFGLVGSLYRSFGQETGSGEPSYRDLENANLFREVSMAPLTGLGFGKEFDEVYPLPSISHVYPRYKMIPHNQLLFAWSYGGPLTVASLSLLFVTMIALAGRLIYDEDMVGYRYLGIFCLFFFVQFFSYVFGDLGLQSNRNLLLGGLLMGGCFRLLMERKMELGQC